MLNLQMNGNHVDTYGNAISWRDVVSLRSVLVVVLFPVAFPFLLVSSGLEAMRTKQTYAYKP